MKRAIIAGPADAINRREAPKESSLGREAGEYSVTTKMSAKEMCGTKPLLILGQAPSFGVQVHWVVG
jgi:hypothetical protein